jgi:hypothetical protein
MLSDYIIAPSITSLFITGFLILFIIVFLLTNFNKLMKSRFYEKIGILCMLTIAISSHGLIHLGVEKNYDFNPYKWF